MDDTTGLDSAKQKRKWHYLQPPAIYDVAPCGCGNTATQWSEFEHHLWCDRCQKDFIPEHGGLFDGPIPLYLSGLLGISFDRYNIETERVERFDELLGYVPITPEIAPVVAPAVGG